MENRRKVGRIMSKVKCPKCEVSATWSHQFFTHFIGAHVKGNNNIKTVIQEISEYEDSSNNEEKLNETKKTELIERISQFEPEEEFERLILDTNKSLTLKCYDLNHFLNANQPICREERQFALFLANCLINTGINDSHSCLNKIINSTDCKIKEVYYEATMMRDYWHIDPLDFNENLWNFVLDKKDRNNKKWHDYSGKKYRETLDNNNNYKHANHWSDEYDHPLARWMMNAKPDIAYLFKEGNSYKLSILECKYSSGEDVYKRNGYEMNQTMVQDLILDFLCSSEKTDTGKKLRYKDLEVKKGDVKLVKFTSDYVTHLEGKNDYIGIPIEDLIKLGYKKACNI